MSTTLSALPGVDSIDTPALVVDLDAMERNIATMAAFCRQHQIAWRPHAKLHKSAELAQLLVQAGAVVVRDVPPHSIVAGNPAQIVGYTVGGNDAAPTALKQAPATPGVVSSSVRGVTLHRLPKVLDLRGNLTVGEFGRSVPFEARRYFMVFGVPNAEVRGEHAHRRRTGQ